MLSSIRDRRFDGERRLLHRTVDPRESKFERHVENAGIFVESMSESRRADAELWNQVAAVDELSTFEEAHLPAVRSGPQRQAHLIRDLVVARCQRDVVGAGAPDDPTVEV